MKKLKVIDDIHYSPSRGFITRNEAIVDCLAVELMPYIEEGTYEYTETIGGDFHIKDEDGDERTVCGVHDWMEFE